jgi:hypothetical protein
MAHQLSSLRARFFYKTGIAFYMINKRSEGTAKWILHGRLVHADPLLLTTASSIFWKIAHMCIKAEQRICLLPASRRFLACSWNLKMQQTCSSETSLVFEGTTRRYIPEDRLIRNYRCENLNSYIGKRSLCDF